MEGIYLREGLRGLGFKLILKISKDENMTNLRPQLDKMDAILDSIRQFKDYSTFDNVSLINANRTRILNWYFLEPRKKWIYYNPISTTIQWYHRYEIIKKLHKLLKLKKNKRIDGLFYTTPLSIKWTLDLTTFKPVYADEYTYNIQKMLSEKTSSNLDYILYFNPIKYRTPQRRNLLHKYTSLWQYLPKNSNLLIEEHVKYKKSGFSERFGWWLLYTLKRLWVPSSVQAYLAWQEVLKKHKPNFLFLIDEYDADQYMGVVAAKKEGIPSIALQHGVIYPSHPGYYHQKEDFSKDANDYIGYIMPDILLVQGKYEERILTKMGYPKKRVRITGQPRYDFLAHADEIFNARRIVSKYKLPQNKRFLLWATQTHGLSKKENTKNVQEIYKAMKILKDKYHLIIKLHPGEDQTARLYHKTFDRSNLATIIPGDANTYELIYISDAIIIKHSTVGVESIIMNKPILLTEVMKSYPLDLYTDYGFDYKIKSYVDVLEYVSQIENGELLSDFENKRKKFMTERVSNFGHATQKVVKILEKFV